MPTRKLSALSFSFLGTLCLSAPVFAAGYSITGLGTLGGSTSYAYGINNYGQIVGESGIAGNAASHAFIYANGVMTDLGTPIGATGSYAVGINNNGQIVGNSYVLDSGGMYTNNRAFLYSNGSMTNLGTLGGDGSYILGNGINTNGRVVGMTWTSGSTTPTGFTYKNGQMTAIAGMTQAAAINDNGQIAGVGVNGHIVLSSNGNVTDLGTLGGSSGFSTGINSNGQVIGASYVTGGANMHAFLYGNGGMIDLGAQPGMDSYAYGINGSGVVVGDYQVVAGQFAPSSSFHAFLYSNGVMTDLNSLIAANSGWTLYGASAINDSGQIVGFGSFNGQDQAFVLTPTAAPVPLPTAAWLFGSGLLGLLGFARKRKAA